MLAAVPRMVCWDDSWKLAMCAVVVWMATYAGALHHNTYEKNEQNPTFRTHTVFNLAHTILKTCAVTCTAAFRANPAVALPVMLVVP